MVSVKLKFRPSSVVGKDGNLYYQVIYKRKVRMMATGYRIAESEWNPITGCIIIHDNSLRIDYLQDIKNKTEHDKKRFKRIVKKMILCLAPNLLPSYDVHKKVTCPNQFHRSIHPRLPETV